MQITNLFKMGRKKTSLSDNKNQFETSSFDDIMTHSYGAKGTFTRELAEIKIKAIAQNISLLNAIKERSQ